MGLTIERWFGLVVSLALLAWCFYAWTAWKNENGAKGLFARISYWIFYLLLIVTILRRAIGEIGRGEHLWWNLSVLSVYTLIAIMLVAAWIKYWRKRRRKRIAATSALTGPQEKAPS